MKDYYKILGISKGSSVLEVKKAYRTLASLHHPDKNPDDPGASDRFKEVAEAYEALTSGKGARKPSLRRPMRSSNIYYEIKISTKISFTESILGAEKDIAFTYKGTCSKCLGSCGDNSGELRTCDKCDGSGRMESSHGYVSISLTCNVCNGSGSNPRRPCRACRGSGGELSSHSIGLKIPPGVVDGSRLRTRTAKGATPVVVSIEVEKSSKFWRAGNDIYSSLELTLSEALLGCSKNVDLIRGPHIVDAPECVQHGSKLRLKKRGATDVDGSNLGDHYIVINVILPKKLTDQQRLAAKMFSEESVDEDSSS